MIIFNWRAVYHQYINLVAYFITIIVLTRVVLNVTSSMLTKSIPIYMLYCPISTRARAHACTTFELCKIAHFVWVFVCEVLRQDSNAKWSVGATI